jgi:hypothetical protein
VREGSVNGNLKETAAFKLQCPVVNDNQADGRSSPEASN